MSMNVRFGTRSCRCEAIRQTPTEATYEIVRSVNPLTAYLGWLKSWFDDLETIGRELEEIKAYAADHPTAEWTAD